MSATKPVKRGSPSEDSCAVCGAKDFRRCPCPWEKPFSDWPKVNRDRLHDTVPRESYDDRRRK